MINVRTVFPFLFRRYFFVLMIGRDWRRQGVVPNDRRVRREPNSPFGVIFVFLTGLMWFILGTAIFTAIVLYLLKSYAGIDLVKGSHPLQIWFRKIYLCH